VACENIGIGQLLPELLILFLAERTVVIIIITLSVTGGFKNPVLIKTA